MARRLWSTELELCPPASPFAPDSMRVERHANAIAPRNNERFYILGVSSWIW